MEGQRVSGTARLPEEVCSLLQPSFSTARKQNRLQVGWKRNDRTEWFEEKLTVRLVADVCGAVELFDAIAGIRSDAF
jgi:hypothetical protein